MREASWLVNLEVREIHSTSKRDTNKVLLMIFQLHLHRTRPNNNSVSAIFHSVLKTLIENFTENVRRDKMNRTT